MRVELGGASLAEGFVGSLVVELSPEAIEVELLSPEVLIRGPGGLSLEGPMHAFVASVLLWFSGLDELGDDAEADPPDGQLGDAPEGVGSEGWSVVGADAVGQAVFLEKPLKHWTSAP